MFYSLELLRKNGPLGIIWVAAMYPKALKLREYLAVNVWKKCTEVRRYVECRVENPVRGGAKPRFSLALSSKLMHGCVVILCKQVDLLLKEISEKGFLSSQFIVHIDLPTVQRPRPLPNLDVSPVVQDVDFGVFRAPKKPSRKRGGPRADDQGSPFCPKRQYLELISPTSSTEEHLLDRQDLREELLTDEFLSPTASHIIDQEWRYVSPREKITVEEAPEDLEFPVDLEDFLPIPDVQMPEVPMDMPGAEEPLPSFVVPELDDTPKQAVRQLDQVAPRPPPQQPTTRVRRVPPAGKTLTLDVLHEPGPERQRRRRRVPRVNGKTEMTPGQMGRNIRQVIEEDERLLDESSHAPLAPGHMAVSANHLLATPGLRILGQPLIGLFQKHLTTEPEPTEESTWASPASEPIPEDDSVLVRGEPELPDQPTPEILEQPMAELPRELPMPEIPEIETSLVSSEELSPAVPVDAEGAMPDLELVPPLLDSLQSSDFSLPVLRHQSVYDSMGPWTPDEEVDISQPLQLEGGGQWCSHPPGPVRLRPRTRWHVIDHPSKSSSGSKGKNLDSTPASTDEGRMAPEIDDRRATPVLSPQPGIIEDNTSQLRFTDDQIINESISLREGDLCRVSPLSDSFPAVRPVEPESPEPSVYQVAKNILEYPYEECTFLDLYPPQTTLKMTAAVAFKRIIELAVNDLITIAQDENYGPIYLTCTQRLVNMASPEEEMEL